MLTTEPDRDREVAPVYDVYCAYLPTSLLTCWADHLWGATASDAHDYFGRAVQYSNKS